MEPLDAYAQHVGLTIGEKKEAEQEPGPTGVWYTNITLIVTNKLLGSIRNWIAWIAVIQLVDVFFIK